LNIKLDEKSEKKNNCKSIYQYFTVEYRNNRNDTFRNQEGTSHCKNLINYKLIIITIIFLFEFKILILLFDFGCVALRFLKIPFFFFVKTNNIVAASSSQFQQNKTFSIYSYVKPRTTDWGYRFVFSFFLKKRNFC
jgi:hypothetical protein